MVHQPANRREQRSQAWKNLAQVQAESVKKQPMSKPGIQTRTIIIVGTALFCALLAVWAFTWTGHFSVSGMWHLIGKK